MDRARHRAELLAARADCDRAAERMRAAIDAALAAVDGEGATAPAKHGAGNVAASLAALTLKEAAWRAGVHVSTMKRWGIAYMVGRRWRVDPRKLAEKMGQT
ncbi:MAG: hypothetical protein WC670_09635 [Pseudolabrys sp.]|jgi:hypothetical protein